METYETSSEVIMYNIGDLVTLNKKSTNFAKSGEILHIDDHGGMAIEATGNEFVMADGTKSKIMYTLPDMVSLDKKGPITEKLEEAAKRFDALMDEVSKKKKKKGKR
jgi:hypothetical protein